ncbi:uncharacterized protein TNCV_4378441 [Trichonephila clavipes]|nr:uncharacterized protein TNCV_4378441 [Trichonephila clavipes]
MIAASPLSADYAMRIATQIESALICKYTRPHSLLIPVFPSPQRTPSPMGRRKRYTPYRASCKQTTTVQSSGHGKTRYIGRPVACVVCLAISPAVCRLFLLACKTMYRSPAGVVPHGRPLLNPRIAVTVV